MRVEGYLFIGAGIFFGVGDVVYWFMSYDPTGTATLAFATAFALLAGFYILFTGRRLPKRPDDDPEGEIAQGTGEIGFFSPGSWWPLFVGISCAVAAVGFAIGWWMFLIGCLLVVLTMIGFVFEYYLGSYAH